MTEDSRHFDKRLVEEILVFCRHVAGSLKITAVCVCGSHAFRLSDSRATIDVLLVVQSFQPRLMNYVKAFGDRTIIVLAVDRGAFEMDVDRGFLGEALASALIFPYVALVSPDYLHDQEVRLKKRLILESLENLILDFPELSYELHIKPEYFMYETMISRARLFPPLVHTWLTFARRNETERNSKGALKGFLEALDELEKEGSIDRSDGYVKISGKLAAEAKTRRVRFVNLLKPAHRALFASVLGVFPNILNILSQNREMLPRFQRAAEEDSKIVREMETPDNYVCVPTARGLVPLADRTDIKAFARRILGADKDAGIVVERLGGVLNDVYLVKATVDGEERRVVVKSFRDWSSFKWFPIVLWSIGTRTFAVLGRSRLERECAMNQLLQSEGFDVPTILHISPSERLIFMEYVEGEKLSIVVKRLANSKTPSIMKKHLNTIRRVGKKMAKVHALGIALGDTKPENILIGKNGEIFFMDFEQASRKGDQVWDVAEFLYYTGHDIPALVDVHVAERIAEAFIGGYLEAGGEAETAKKAGNPKYTKVFSVFTLPHIMIVISNVCRRADKLRL